MRFLRVAISSAVVLTALFVTVVAVVIDASFGWALVPLTVLMWAWRTGGPT